MSQFQIKLMKMIFQINSFFKCSHKKQYNIFNIVHLNKLKFRIFLLQEVTVLEMSHFFLNLMQLGISMIMINRILLLPILLK